MKQSESNNMRKGIKIRFKLPRRVTLLIIAAFLIAPASIPFSPTLCVAATAMPTTLLKIAQEITQTGALSDDAVKFIQGYIKGSLARLFIIIDTLNKILAQIGSTFRLNVNVPASAMAPGTVFEAAVTVVYWDPPARSVEFGSYPVGKVTQNDREVVP